MATRESLNASAGSTSANGRGVETWALIEQATREGKVETISQRRVIVVDPVATSASRLRRRLTRRGYDAPRVATGAEALAAVARERPELAIVAPTLPDMGSPDLIRRLSATEFGMPVWALNNSGEPGIAAAAFEAGAIDSVHAGVSPGRLTRMLASLSGGLGGARVSWHPKELAEATSRFDLPNDPDMIGPLTWRLLRSVARLRAFDSADTARVATALREALLNAIEHGNLEVCSSLRELEGDAYHRLVDARRASAPYCGRRVSLVSRISPAALSFVVRDEGPGFDPGGCDDPTTEGNLERSSGRGLLLIRAFMDEVTFNAAGNEVTLIKRTAT
jgi:anti-sigma regulatory factor (Ser/Thr protein kinase)